MKNFKVYGIFFLLLLSNTKTIGQKGNKLSSLIQQYLKDSTTIFAEETLVFLDKPSLQKLRNLPFAKRGLQFKDKTLLAYFSKFNWYHPVMDSVSENSLNKYERLNIENIFVFTNKNGIFPIDTEKYLTALNGCWQVYTTTVASGYDNRYLFNKRNLTFSFKANQMTTMPGLISQSGKFKLLNNSTLYLTITDQVFSSVTKSKRTKKENKTPIPQIASVEAMQHPVKEIHPIGPVYTITIDDRIKSFFKLGTDYYWKIADDPDHCKD